MGKRIFATRHLVKNRAQAEEVASIIQLLTAQLLRRHVGHGSRYNVDLRHNARAFTRQWSFLNRLGQSEVQHFHVAAGPDHDVFRLDVAMDDAVSVRFSDGADDLAPYLYHF